MTQVVASNTNNTVKVYSVGLQGATGPSGSLQSSNSGSFAITGSLIVSGSNTFTNIGPSILSGSVTSTSGFTGSLQGTSSFATSASYILNAVSASFATSASRAISSSFATTASFALNAGTTVSTASLLITGSATNNVLTFTKGDGSTFNLIVDTGSAITTPTGSLMVTGSVSSNTLTFTKGDGSTFNLTVDTGSGGGSTPTLAQVTAQGSTTGDALTIQGMTFKSGSTFPGLTANSVFVGYQVGNNSDNNASLNVGVGYRAMLNNNTAQNIALGANSLENGTVGENIGIGYLSVSNVKAGQNIGIGAQTLRYIYSGSQNTVIGSVALPFSTTTENESSSNKSGNVVIGYGALFAAVRSYQNTIIGTLSHSAVTSMGQFNTAIGSSNVSSGSYNIILGVGNSLLGYGENSIVIGNNHNLNNLNSSVIIGNQGAIKFRSSGSVTTLFEDTVISGSLTVSGSEVLTLVPVNPLPSGVATGSFAVSGSTPPRPYFFDGTSWIALI